MSDALQHESLSKRCRYHHLRNHGSETRYCLRFVAFVAISAIISMSIVDSSIFGYLCGTTVRFDGVSDQLTLFTVNEDIVTFRRKEFKVIPCLKHNANPVA